MTTTVSERVSQSAFDGSMLRVVLLMDLHEGAQQRFFEAYEQLRHDIASVPGHISDQLCQSFENPSQWLITSEWESAPQYLAWVNSEHHAEQVKPLGACARAMRPLKFTVLRETGRAYDQAARPVAARLQPTPGSAPASSATPSPSPSGRTACGRSRPSCRATPRPRPG